MNSKDYISNLIKEFNFGNIFERRERIKIAVSGWSGSGKTYFIASTINQLLSGKKIQRVARERGVEFVGRLVSENEKQDKEKDENSNLFPYRTIVDISQGDEGKWLGSTTTISRALIELEIKSKNKLFPNKFLEIELVDYPGEWLADLPLYEKNFADWGDEVIADIRNSSQKRDFAREWLNSISGGDIYSYSDGSSDEDIVASFKTYLKSLGSNGYTFIQPSRHLFKNGVADASILLFTPLPKPKYLTPHEDSLYSRFNRRYIRYQKEFVNLIYETWFKEFDRQIILLDIFKPLSNGKNSFYDLSSSIFKIVKLYKYGANTFLKYLTYRKIDRVIFCATKSDLVPQEQRENLQKLLINTIEEATRELKLQNIETNIFTISSVEGKIKGGIDNSITIPEAIENIENNKEFNIQKAFPPQFSERNVDAVNHINMDLVIDKLIGDRL